MPEYLTHFTYTRESWRAMVSSPEDRLEAARRVVEAAGGRLDRFYWTLGEYDGLAIFSVPDAESAAAVSAAISASGRVARMHTTRLLTGDEARRALEKAKVVRESYDPPGGERAWRADYDEGITVA